MDNNNIIITIIVTTIMTIDRSIDRSSSSSSSSSSSGWSSSMMMMTCVVLFVDLPFSCPASAFSRTRQGQENAHHCAPHRAAARLHRRSIADLPLPAPQPATRANRTFHAASAHGPSFGTTATPLIIIIICFFFICFFIIIIIIIIFFFFFSFIIFIIFIIFILFFVFFDCVIYIWGARPWSRAQRRCCGPLAFAPVRGRRTHSAR
jgi:hypothetical protein